MRNLMGGAALALVLMTAVGAHAAPPPLEAYGQLPAIDKISLSPSGQSMVSIGDVDGKRYLLVRTLAGAVQMAVPVPTAKVRQIFWADDQHIIVEVSEANISLADLGREEYPVFLNIDLAAKKSNVLFSHDYRFFTQTAVLIATYVIDGRPYAFLANQSKEGKMTGTQMQGSFDGDHYWRDLWRIDLTSNAIEKVGRGTIDVETWAVGPDGTIVGYTNYYDKTSTWALMRGEKTLMQRKSVRLSTNLSGQGRTPGSLLVFDQSGATDAWIEVGADGKTDALWADASVIYPIHSRTTGLLMGALLKPNHVQFFDPGQQARIDAAMRPFHGLVEIESRTDAIDKLILHTSGPGDSGTYYLVDVAAHKADIIENDYPDVPADQVGDVRLVRYKAADGMDLDGVLTLPPGGIEKNLPVVVLPHGGPIGVEDVVGFNWIAQAFASRGYAVFQPNYRGSGGHGAAFQDAGFGECGRKMLTDASDGLQALVKEGVADPKRACIVGFSYGGYAAMAGITVQQGLYRCAVAGSGLSDLPRFLKWLRDREGAENKFEREAMGVTVPGAPSLDSISPAKLAARADAPLLLIHGTDDSVVPIEQSQEMADALKAAGKPVQFVVTKNEDHWLSSGATRTETLKAAVAFVQTYNPAQ